MPMVGLSVLKNFDWVAQSIAVLCVQCSGSQHREDHLF